MPKKQRKIEIHVCCFCERESAAYEGLMPREWVRMPELGDDYEACRHCSIADARARKRAVNQ